MPGRVWRTVHCFCATLLDEYSFDLLLAESTALLVWCHHSSSAVCALVTLRSAHSAGPPYLLTSTQRLQQLGAPSTLPGAAADFLPTLAAASHTGDPFQSGQAVREAIDQQLLGAGAMIIEDLPFADNVSAASDFIRGLGFKIVKYEPMGPPRKKACLPALILLRQILQRLPIPSEL